MTRTTTLLLLMTWNITFKKKKIECCNPLPSKMIPMWILTPFLLKNLMKKQMSQIHKRVWKSKRFQHHC